MKPVTLLRKLLKMGSIVVSEDLYFHLENGEIRFRTPWTESEEIISSLSEFLSMSNLLDGSDYMAIANYKESE